MTQATHDQAEYYFRQFKKINLSSKHSGLDYHISEIDFEDWFDPKDIRLIDPESDAANLARYHDQVRREIIATTARGQKGPRHKLSGGK